MAKTSEYVKRLRATGLTVEEATRRTIQQYMMDVLQIALTDPEVMGGDPWGAKRIDRLLQGWGKYYDEYFDAISDTPETDYRRVKLDEQLEYLCVKGGNKFYPFLERYVWLKDVTYEPKRFNHEHKKKRR
jgi:hypothetical protein